MMITRQRSNLTSLIREHNKMAMAASSSACSTPASSTSTASQSSGNSSWSKREKLLGINSNLDFGFDSGNEFLEEDVWGMVDEFSTAADDQLADQFKPQPQPQPQPSAQSSESNGRLFSKWLSPAGSSNGNWERRQSIVSAPVNVPDWSKILHKKSGQRPISSTRGGLSEESDSDGEKESSEEWIPPHTLAARQDAARISTMVAFSVLEGAGRTLKGRDLRRVRNAVWQQTGYMAAGLV